MTHFGNLHLDMADTVYQSPGRVVVRYPHRTPLQWAERQESCQIEENVFSYRLTVSCAT